MCSTGKGRSSAKGSTRKDQPAGVKTANNGGRVSRQPQTGRGLPAAAPEGAGRLSLYDEVTARIVTELEAGRAPWVRPWSRPGHPAPALPRNALTGRPYSGVNILLLWAGLIEHGYGDQAWLTYRQAAKAGGQVRKGERGTGVVFADRFTPKAEAERAALAGETAGSVAFLKRFTVFNLDQCEGLEHLASAPAAPIPEREIIPHVEALIVATGADFRVGGNEAFYSPTFDYVRVPPQQAFGRQINYYRTVLHELSHWTGHPSRLDRDQSGPFGSKPYGFEELVAELSAAFACAALGVAPTVRHADYIGAWLAILKADNRAIFRAASKASKAAEFLMAFDPRGSATGAETSPESAETADPDDDPAPLAGRARAAVMFGEAAA
jgi:antirestriction protein ArdC